MAYNNIHFRQEFIRLTLEECETHPVENVAVLTAFRRVLCEGHILGHAHNSDMTYTIPTCNFSE